jgi:hypothetical protein
MPAPGLVGGRVGPTAVAPATEPLIVRHTARLEGLSYGAPQFQFHSLGASVEFSAWLPAKSTSHKPCHTTGCCISGTWLRLAATGQESV